MKKLLRDKRGKVLDPVRDWYKNRQWRKGTEEGIKWAKEEAKQLRRGRDAVRKIAEEAAKKTVKKAPSQSLGRSLWNTVKDGAGRAFNWAKADVGYRGYAQVVKKPSMFARLAAGIKGITAAHVAVVVATLMVVAAGSSCYRGVDRIDAKGDLASDTLSACKAGGSVYLDDLKTIGKALLSPIDTTRDLLKSRNVGGQPDFAKRGDAISQDPQKAAPTIDQSQPDILARGPKIFQGKISFNLGFPEQKSLTTSWRLEPVGTGSGDIGVSTTKEDIPTRIPKLEDGLDKDEEESGQHLSLFVTVLPLL